MEKYIEHKYNGSVVLIPVDPAAALQVRFVPSERPDKKERGDINANVGSLSFLLYGDVEKEASDELIRDFVSKYKEAGAEKEYVSTTWVVAACILVTAVVLYFSDAGDSDTRLLKQELENIRTQNEVFSPSNQVVDELMEIPDERVLDVMDAKERYLSALEKMKGMDVNEREAFINTPQMQELINTSWVQHIQQE